MKAQLVELILRGISHCSISTQRRLGNWLGRRLYKKQGRDYRVTTRNIEACFPDLSTLEQQDLVLKSLQATATVAMETPAVWFRGDKWLDRAVLGVENAELFEQAVQSERGVILLVPHFGNWELAGFWCARHRGITAMYRPPRMEFLDGLVRKVRKGTGDNKLVPANPRGVLAVVQALSKGGMTMVLPDQQPDIKSGIFSPFFGHPALTVSLINRLIVKTDPLVLIAYARRVDNGHIVGFCEPEEEIYSADPQISVDAMNRSIEALAKTAPEQYQWEYKRFRTQPEGAPRFYS